MSAPRRFAFVLLLCLAQLGALVHALGHVRDDTGAAPESCAICLVAHALAAALPPVLLPIAAAPATFVLATRFTASSLRADAPQPTQRGPPPA